MALSAVHATAAGRPVSLTSSDGTPLAGLFFEASLRPAPGVVLVHMLGRSKEDWHAVADRLQEGGVSVLAVDLRGHGSSGGSPSALTSMADDVRAAARWLMTRPTVRPGAVALVGASLGANLAALVAGDDASIRLVALLSPSLDYRGIRLDQGAIKKLSDRQLWLASSMHDPYALRTVKELATGGAAREQRLSDSVAHGTNLLTADPEIARGLVDWLRTRLIF